MMQELWDLVLSHHHPKDYDRCFSLSFQGEEYHLCSRCVGWYSSFIFFWIAVLLGMNFLLGHQLLILYLFSVPALIDWSFHRFEIYEGTNLTRLTTGFLIGLAFAALIYRVFKNPLDPHFWIVVTTYTSVAAAVLSLTKDNRFDRRHKSWIQRGTGRKNPSNN